MRTVINILQDGKPQEIEALFQQISFVEIETPLLFFNLKPISYATLCGNIEMVEYLINKNCNLSVINSSDCNLLTWALLCNEKQVGSAFIEYISKNKIYRHFDDDTQELHLNYLMRSSFEAFEYSDSKFLTSDGLSIFYYLLLSQKAPSEVILDKLKDIELTNIIHLNSDKMTENKIKRLARYLYITGYYLYKHGLIELSLESFKKSISHYEQLKNKYSYDLRELSYIYYSLGKIYYKLSKWSNATECYKTAVVIHNEIKVSCKIFMDHQDLTNYRTSLAGYFHDELEEIYFSRYVDYT